MQESPPCLAPSLVSQGLVSEHFGRKADPLGNVYRHVCDLEQAWGLSSHWISGGAAQFWFKSTASILRCCALSGTYVERKESLREVLNVCWLKYKYVSITSVS